MIFSCSSLCSQKGQRQILFFRFIISINKEQKNIQVHKNDKFQWVRCLIRKQGQLFHKLVRCSFTVVGTNRIFAREEERTKTKLHYSTSSIDLVSYRSISTNRSKKSESKIEGEKEIRSEWFSSLLIMQSFDHMNNQWYLKWICKMIREMYLHQVSAQIYSLEWFD